MLVHMSHVFQLLTQSKSIIAVTLESQKWLLVKKLSIPLSHSDKFSIPISDYAKKLDVKVREH